MSTNKHLTQLTHNTSEGGDGIVKTIPVPLGSVKSAAGLSLTGATAPTIAATETNGLAIVGAASTTALGSILWTVPDDYDVTSDHLKVLALINAAGATDAALTLDATVYRKREVAALTADLNPTASAVIPSHATPTNIAAWREVDISGEGMLPGDALVINLLTQAHTTDAVQIWAVEIEYKSMIVANYTDDRT